MKLFLACLLAVFVLPRQKSDFVGWIDIHGPACSVTKDLKPSNIMILFGEKKIILALASQPDIAWITKNLQDAFSTLNMNTDFFIISKDEVLIEFRLSDDGDKIEATTTDRTLKIKGGTFNLP